MINNYIVSYDILLVEWNTNQFYVYIYKLNVITLT